VLAPMLLTERKHTFIKLTRGFPPVVTDSAQCGLTQ